MGFAEYPVANGTDQVASFTITSQCIQHHDVPRLSKSWTLDKKQLLAKEQDGIYMVCFSLSPK